MQQRDLKIAVNRYTCTGAQSCSKQRYAGQLYDNNRKDKTNKPRAERSLYTKTENVNV